MKCLIALLMMLVALPLAADDKLFDTNDREDKGIVIPLGIESGAAIDRLRDTRVFTVPVICSGEKATFTWSGSGQTVITAAYAKKLSLKITRNEDLEAVLGADGKPLFLGDTAVELELGGKKQLATVYVVRDGELARGMSGMIGFDIAKGFQWQVDPGKQQITLKRPGAPLTKTPLVTVPLTEDNLDLTVHVKFRGVEEDMSLQANASYVQVAEKLQQAWEAALVGKPAAESKVGGVRMINLVGEKDGIAFSDKFIEENVAVMLLSDGGTAKSGIGAAVLNRYVYVVDPQRKELAFVERAPAPAAPGAKPAAK